MRSLFTLAIVLSSFCLSAQTIHFKVKGAVKNTSNAKYAYISTLSQQIPISSDKVFIVTPIINGKFQLSGTFDLKGKPYQHACVFLDSRGNISKEELASKFKQLIWITGQDKHLRIIILENISLDVQERDKMIVSTVVAGGRLTKQLDEEGLAIIAGNKKMIDFIKTYPDSPISFDRVKNLCDFIDSRNKSRLESHFGSLNDLYASLSQKLRNSKEGIALRKEIEEKNKAQ